MQKLVSKYALAAHLAFLAVAPSILLPFCSAGTTAVTMLWLTLAAALWIFLEPSRRAVEMLHEARIRTASAVVRDPLLWLFAAVAVFAAIRWANGGIAIAYDAQASKWSVRPQTVAWLPGSVDGEGFLQFATVLALMCVTTGCRHALGRAARAAFLFCGSLFAGAGALAAVLAAWSGNCSADHLMALDPRDGVFAGPACGVWLLASVVALAGGLELKWNKLLLLFSFSAGSCALGLFYFAPPATVLLFAALFVVVLLACAVYLYFMCGAVDVLRFFAGIFIASVLPVFTAVFAAPETATAAKFAAFSEWSIVPDGFWALRERLSDIAASIWRGHAWLGSGLGSFPLEARFLATEADWPAWGGVAPHAAIDGWRHLLAERGIAGAAMVVMPGLFLLFTYAVRLAKADFFRAFLPMCLLGPLVAAAFAAEAFFDVSFLDPACMLAAASVVAVSASAFPPARKAESGEIPKTGER